MIDRDWHVPPAPLSQSANPTKMNQNDYSNETYTLRVDSRDIVRYVNPDWVKFARRNGNPRLGQEVLGRSLFDYIFGPDTYLAIQMLVRRVRESNNPTAYSFRCDSPDELRWMEMNVVPADDLCVEFHSKVTKTETRTGPQIGAGVSDFDSGENLIVVCSNCKRIEMESLAWVEVDVALDQLDYFNLDPNPGFTHGLCQDCYLTITGLPRDTQHT